MNTGIDELASTSRLVDAHGSIPARRCRLVNQAGIDDRADLLAGWLGGWHEQTRINEPARRWRLVDVPLRARVVSVDKWGGMEQGGGAGKEQEAKEDADGVCVRPGGLPYKATGFALCVLHALLSRGHRQCTAV